MSDVKKQFGVSVRAWRTHIGISQEELAGRAGLHRTYVSDVERGARNLSVESIEKLAAALEIPIAELFSGNGEKLAPQVRSAATTAEVLVSILLVEDNADDVDLAMRAFKVAGLSNRVVVARDGAEALNYWFRRENFADRPIDDGPHIVLLDLGLPSIPGLEVLRQIKAAEDGAKTQVVVLSGSRYERDVTESRRLGANGFIVKPLIFQNLCEVTPHLRLQWVLTKPMALSSSSGA